MTSRPIKAPFDSLVLAAVTAELQRYVGGRVQGIRQPTDFDVMLGLYAGGQESMLRLSCHPVFARVHLATKRPPNPPAPPGFCAALRARIDGGTLAFARQVGFDRILHLGFESAKGAHVLVAELMGKHSNLILVGPDGRVVASAKNVGRGKSSRPIHNGVPYEPPPLPERPSLLEATETDDLRDFEGASPFLLRLIEAMGPGALGQIQERVRQSRFDPVIAPGVGAYAISLASLGVTEHPRSSMSAALESHFDTAVLVHEADALRQSLVGQLSRVVLARDVALADLRQAAAAGEKAARWQLYGELILAYGTAIFEGQRDLRAWDYEGNEVEIRLEPDLDFKANANRYFERAKKAKGRQGLVQDQIARLETERDLVQRHLERVQNETRLDRLQELQEEARAKRWLIAPPVPNARKEDRPYEGHRVRELLGPQGLTVLYGENAEANDYLTLRVAKSNDWWLHVRGNTSSHVVIVTRNQPDKVSREAIAFAAKIAVQHSPLKHSAYVPVDYTLKKYVRKPKGSPKGTASYSNENTIHVEGG